MANVKRGTFNSLHVSETLFRHKGSQMKTAESRPRLVGINELATLTGISTRTLQDYYRDHGMPCIRTSARLIRFNPERVIDWLEQTYGQNAKQA